MKVTVKPRSRVTPVEKVIGFAMVIIGFFAALAIGYGLLPTLLYEKIDQPFQFNSPSTE